jgi:hypothetical protein
VPERWRSTVNVRAIALPAVALAMVGAGIVTSRDSEAVAIALIVVGAGTFFIGALQSTLTEFQIGPSGFSAKLRERDRDFQATLGPDADSLMRTAAWLAGSAERGKELVERAMVDTYMRWPRESSEGPADAVRKRLVELAPPATKAPPPSSTEGGEKRGAGELLSKLLSLPVGERSAIVLNLIDGMDVGAVASVTRREPKAVAADIDRVATELLAYGAAAGSGADA